MTDLIDRSSEELSDDVPAGADSAADDAITTTAEAVSTGRQDGSFALPATTRSALAALLAAAGVIHLVMVPSHWGESVVEGTGFLVAGWLQIVLAVGLGLRPTRWALQLSVLANVVLIAVWAVARTAGLPFGPHAGHAESVSIVDATTVGLELAAILLAVGLLIRGIDFVRSGSKAFGFGVPVAALVLASIAVASPSARDHAAAAHGDHGTHGEMGHGHADDKGLSLLTNGHQHGQGEETLDDATQAQLAVQLAGTRVLVERYPTVAAAEAAGYLRAGPFVPGLGTHYRHPTFSTSDVDGDGLIGPTEIDKPLLIFDGTDPQSPIAGFMYYVGGEATPEGFVGPNDHWHYHTNVCMISRPDGTIETPFTDRDDITQAMCNDMGGELLQVTGNMLHVWTVPGYESNLGVFNEVNPAIACPDGSYYQIPLEDAVDRLTTCRNT